MNEVVKFREILHGVSRLRVGIRHQNLVIVPEYQTSSDVWFIYNLISRTKFFDPGLLTQEFALQVAELFTQIYQDYIFIPRAWEGADVIRLARYSVKHGLQFNAMHELDTVLTREQFKHEFRRLS